MPKNKGYSLPKSPKSKLKAKKTASVSPKTTRKKNKPDIKRRQST